MHIVLDDTAMVAVGKGDVLASPLIHRAQAEGGWFLCAAAIVTKAVLEGLLMYDRAGN